MNLTYARFEMKRLIRNRQNFIFSLIFPVILLFAIAGANGDKIVTGDITFARFYMAGMIGFGTLAAVFSGGARIADERRIGWNRQLRLTPLSPRAYLQTKVLTSYVLAVLSLLLVTGAASIIGASFTLRDWLSILGLVLVALIPFAALGVMIGHIIKADSLGPVIGGGISLFAIAGGAYFPIGTDPGVLHEIIRVVPSFWLIQAGKTGVGGESWTPEAWIVVAAWSVVLSLGAAWAYRRDTQRA